MAAKYDGVMDGGGHAAVVTVTEYRGLTQVDALPERSPKLRATPCMSVHGVPVHRKVSMKYILVQLHLSISLVFALLLLLLLLPFCLFSNLLLQ